MTLRKSGVARSRLITLLALFVRPAGASAAGGNDPRTRKLLLRGADLDDPDDLGLKGEVRARARADR